MRDRAAIIVNNLDVIGGIQLTALAIAKVLAETGFEVHIYCLNSKEKVLKYYNEILGLTAYGVKVTKISLPLTFSKCITCGATTLKVYTKLANLKYKYSLVINAHGDIQPVLADVVYFHQFNVDYAISCGSIDRKIRNLILWHIRKSYIEQLKSYNILILVNSYWTLIEAQKFWELRRVECFTPL